MCLYAPPDAKIRIAKRNIKVIKILCIKEKRRDFLSPFAWRREENEELKKRPYYCGIGVSPYFYFTYERGKLYKSSLRPKVERDCVRVYKGLHAYLPTQNLRDVNAFKITMIIPKGAKYILGDFNGRKSIASNRLLWPNKKSKRR